MLSIDEIKEILYNYFDIDEEYADDEKGCFINGKWLSIGEIIKVLEKYS